MPGYLDRDPATLSGGQAARVALARTLLAEPEALLLDEPFSRLDVELRALVRGLFFDLVAERKIPSLLVTHDLEDAPQAGEFWTLVQRRGRDQGANLGKRMKLSPGG